MNDATQAILFNGVPLLLLAAAYAAVTGAVLPVLWRDRTARTRSTGRSCSCSPAIAFAAGVFGVLVLQEQRPFGGHVWISFAACLAALAPAVPILSAGASARSSHAASAGRSWRSSGPPPATATRGGLGDLRRTRAGAHPGRRRPAAHRTGRALLRVGFVGIALVDEDADWATGLYAEAAGEEATWWAGVRTDLRHEPSGIASAVFDALPVTVYDVSASLVVSMRLARLVGARSGAWVPMVAEERVVGVLVLASTDEKRVVHSRRAHAAAGGLDRGGTRVRAAAVSGRPRRRTERDLRAAEIVQRVRAELQPDEVVRVARVELRRALSLDEIRVELTGADANVDVRRRRR